MTYTVVYAAECGGCETQSTLTYFQASTPPALEAIGTEALDGECALCKSPRKYTLVGVTMSGYQVVEEEDE